MVCARRTPRFGTGADGATHFLAPRNRGWPARCRWLSHARVLPGTGLGHAPLDVVESQIEVRLLRPAECGPGLEADGADPPPSAVAVVGQPGRHRTRRGRSRDSAVAGPLPGDRCGMPATRDQALHPRGWAGGTLLLREGRQKPSRPDRRRLAD